MNVDAEIKAAQERIHRQIGQWARRDKRWIAEAVAYQRARMQYAYLFPPSRGPVSG